MADKGVLAVLAVLTAGALAVPLLLRKKPEEAPVQIEILDAQGNPLPRNSPFILSEGASYTTRVTITNTSTRAGTPWPADLSIGINAATPLTQLIPAQLTPASFAAGETKSFNFPLNIPWESGGQVGEITAWVKDPGGIVIGSAVAPITIEAVAVDYSATITIM